MENAYKILGLQPGASKKEIRTAYRTLAKKYHPDKHQQKQEYAAIFQKIQGHTPTLWRRKHRRCPQRLTPGKKNRRPIGRKYLHSSIFTANKQQQNVNIKDSPGGLVWVLSLHSSFW